METKKTLFFGIIAIILVLAFSTCDDGTKPSPPSVPTGISTVATSSSSITVSWDAVDNADGYNVYRSSSASDTYTLIGTPSTASYTDTGLSGSTTYYYKISANNSAGESSQSIVVSATTFVPIPDTPTDVNATATSTSSITVSWAAVSGATEYYVYRSSSATGTYTRVGTSSTASYTNTGLSGSTTYYYKVSAYNNSGESFHSLMVSATTMLDTPTGVSAEAISSSSIKISWTAVSNADGYYVYRSSYSTSTYTYQVGTSSTTSYTDTDLSAGNTYYYKVSAYNNLEESSQSSYASWTFIPSTPTGVSATGSGAVLTVGWNAVLGATGYRVYFHMNSTITLLETIPTTSYTNYTFGYTGGMTGYITVTAYNSAGESARSSLTTIIYPPSTPTKVNAMGTSSSSITISWDAVSGAAGYRVYRSPSISGTYTQIGTSSTTSYIDTGLSANTYYNYKISASNIAGVSAQSPSVYVKTKN